MKKEYGITLKIFYDIPLEDQDESVKKFDSLVEALDPWALTCLYRATITGKSTATALALLKSELTIEGAVKVARCDEEFQ